LDDGLILQSCAVLAVNKKVVNDERIQCLVKKLQSILNIK
jgi:hypothetical protein